MKPLPSLLRWIQQGEHQKQDFKQTISNAYKIAKTLVAFANTQGGRLLIGVKDNGKISGVNPEEELYMIDYAAKRLCQPPVKYYSFVHRHEDREVLEVVIPESKNKPHYAIDEQSGKPVAFIRVGDQLRMASLTYLRYLKERHRYDKPVRMKFSKIERRLLELLEEQPYTMKQLAKRLNISYRRTRRILLSLLLMDVIQIHHEADQDYYSAKSL